MPISDGPADPWACACGGSGEDLLKGIIADEHDDDEAAFADDDDALIDDFDFDEVDGNEGVDMHNFGDEDFTVDLSPEEKASMRKVETQFFNAADESKDGFLDEHEYVRAMMKEMFQNELNDESKPTNPKAVGPSATLLETGPLKTEGMTANEKKHFEELEGHFKEEDLDNDGKISLEEWLNIMFHDEPQMPEFEEGMENLINGYPPRRRINLTPEEKVPLSLSLSLSLSRFLSIYLSLARSLARARALSLFTSLPLCLFLFLSLSLSLHILSIYICIINPKP